MAKRDFSFRLPIDHMKRGPGGKAVVIQEFTAVMRKKFFLLIANIFKIGTHQIRETQNFRNVISDLEFYTFFLYKVNFLQGQVVKELHVLNVQKPIFSIGHKLRNLLDRRQDFKG